MRAALIALALLATPAWAEDGGRELCADRPGLGTPACTVAPGKLQIETGLADWTRESDADVRTDTVVGGDTLLRIGVDDATEARVAWTPYGHVRERDRALHRTSRQSGIGDVTIGLRRNLHNPDGSGLSVALQPSLALPVGGQAIGEGTWSASLLVPLDFELAEGIGLALTPEVDAAADADRHGRHLAFGSVAGLSFDLGKAVTTSVEVEALRDDDPSGHATQVLGALSVAWQPQDQLQLDAGLVAGLNRNSPDVEIAVGVVRRF